MQHVNEASIASLLITRFNKDKVFTRAGARVLLAINPRRPITVSLPRPYAPGNPESVKPLVCSLYNPAVMQRYFEESQRAAAEGSKSSAAWLSQRRRGEEEGALPPHIFAAADTCLRNLESEGISQSMLFTGETDGGKTENFRQALRYMMCVSRARSHAAGAPVPASEAAETVLSEFTTVLDAFGSAPSAGNPSSSRQAWMVSFRLQDGRVSKARIRAVLMDAGRVSERESGPERNFHLFSAVLAGLAPEERAALGFPTHDKMELAFGPKDGLGEAKRDTGPGDGDSADQDARRQIEDADKFRLLQRALDACGLGAEDRGVILRQAAGVLQLVVAAVHAREAKASAEEYHHLL